MNDQDANNEPTVTEDLTVENSDEVKGGVENAHFNLGLGALSATNQPNNSGGSSCPPRSCGYNHNETMTADETDDTKTVSLSDLEPNEEVKGGVAGGARDNLGLGGLSAADQQNDDRHVRHRLFAIVDRTQ